MIGLARVLAQEAATVEGAPSCLGFGIDCQTLWVGIAVSIMAVILFIGSIYLLLTALFGRWMAYLVTVVALSGWMILQSALWLFGFWSQGVETPTNLGPKGSEPAWVVTSASTQGAAGDDATYADYPAAPWVTPTKEQEGEKTSIEGVVQVFMAEQANEELGIDHLDPTAVQPPAFTVSSVSLATGEDDEQLAVAQVAYSGGGPLWTVSLYYDSGSVPRYSIMFLVLSIVIFAIHLPLLDRAERSRKAFLVGGEAPSWYGPA